MIGRSARFKEVPVNIVGSSTFGRYPKISVEKTINMFISDGWLVDYSGYQTAISSSNFASATTGRACYTSTALNKMVVVIGSGVYLVDIFFDQNLLMTQDFSATLIGNLQTAVNTINKKVYITGNNKPQILISDCTALYLYDPAASPTFKTISGLDFTPGYVDFHDTYFICAASNDQFYSPPANNTWRLSAQNDGSSWPNASANIGLLQTKPDNIQAVVRFPSRGNMVLVMGKTVSEPWYDVGYQLFPYQRSNSFSVDYGCLNPSTIAATDEIVCWLAGNEKSGPVIMYTTGGAPEKITTDGIDYLFSQLKNPADSQGWIMRQDGHLIYQINFHTDNLSLFYDFNTKRFFNATDENLNYFIASQVAFFNNQYYFVSEQNGNLYAFDTIYTTYDGAEIPRIRTCKSVRLPSQEYRIFNDFGFTIETGETPFQKQDGGSIFLVTQTGSPIITQGTSIFFVTQDGKYVVTQNGLSSLVFQNSDLTDFNNLIDQNNLVLNIVPRIDLSISIDGGASFSSDFGYELNPLGYRKNKLMWWQLGLANDWTPQLKFWGLGRFVATDGIVNIR